MSDRVEVGAAGNGALTYLLDFPPEHLPAVAGADLARAWAAARAAAAAGAWGAARHLVFRRAEGDIVRLAITDDDARCWAGAVDRSFGLESCHGLSVCLRLLALVELLGRAPVLADYYVLEGGEAEFHPALLGAAASCRLDSDARLVEGEVCDRLRLRSHPPGPAAG
jgi:hypothetical protein